ncbi:MAG TPA: EAL domain-containing protein [Chloroflexota bacterium]|nr:EAL domain-containing protein [Chloroflexota bacterium]
MSALPDPSELPLEAALAAISSGVVILDAMGAVVYANEEASRILGLTHDQIMARTAYDPVWRVTRADGLAALESDGPISLALRTGQTQHDVAVSVVLPDGAPRWLRVHAAPILDPNRAVRHVVATFRDITAHRRADEALRASEARFRSLYDYAPIGVALLDPQGCPVMVNHALEGILGYGTDELCRMTFSDFTHPDDFAADWALFQELLAGKRNSYTMDKRYIHKDGHVVWGQLAVSVSRDRNGSPPSIIGMVLDITERKEADLGRELARVSAEELARVRQEQAEEMALMSAVGEALSSTLDPDKLYSVILEQVARALPCDVADVLLFQDGWIVTAANLGTPSPPVGTQLAPLDSLTSFWQPASDRPTYVADTLEEPSWHEVPPNVGDRRIRSLIAIPLVVDGLSVGCFSVCSRQPHFYTAKHLHLAGLFAERVTHALRNARLHAAMRRQARHDSLTGLPNRLLLHERLDTLLGTAKATGQSISLLLLDLDRFKDVNDTLGHLVGDGLLQHIATRLQRALGVTDTVCRLGGDEFALVLPAVDAEGATAVARLVLAALETPFQVGPHLLDPAGSVGIAVYPEHGTDGLTLLRHADVAMYVAKRSQSGVALYESAHDQHSIRRLELARDLRVAIREDGLRLYYQPKVALPSGQFRGVEALLRWSHPTHGFIPPDEFVPLAEHTGLIGSLTEWVLLTALRQGQAWREAGQIIPIAINLSARGLQDQQFPDLVDRHIARCGGAPGDLTLEITEGSLMTDPARAREVLVRLHALGVRLAIDDFGTGYSSLGYLKELPVDEVKIDKSFVLGMGTGDRRDEAIVRSVVAMAHALGLSVVAEGVEDAVTFALLGTFGCDVAQGYYLSRPKPAVELNRWMNEYMVKV